MQYDDCIHYFDRYEMGSEAICAFMVDPVTTKIHLDDWNYRLKQIITADDFKTTVVDRKIVNGDLSFPIGHDVISHITNIQFEGNMTDEFEAILTMNGHSFNIDRLYLQIFDMKYSRIMSFKSGWAFMDIKGFNGTVIITYGVPGTMQHGDTIMWRIPNCNNKRVLHHRNAYILCESEDPIMSITLQDRDHVLTLQSETLDYMYKKVTGNKRKPHYAIIIPSYPNHSRLFGETSNIQYIINGNRVTPVFLVDEVARFAEHI